VATFESGTCSCAGSKSSLELRTRGGGKQAQRRKQAQAGGHLRVRLLGVLRALGQRRTRTGSDDANEVKQYLLASQSWGSTFSHNNLKHPAGVTPMPARLMPSPRHHTCSMHRYYH
jgi:hypothetical protein